MPTTIPPMITPRMAMIMGSSRLVNASTASSTSASYQSATLPNMVSMAPDSSPMATICTTMLGNSPDSRMQTCNWVPVEISSRIFRVASWKMTLPVAPATEVIASTSGVPAANMVSRVRAKRAIADFSRISPMTGIFNEMRSRKWANGTERRFISTKP